MKANWFVGHRKSGDSESARVMFRFVGTPTEASHGRDFYAVVGPFKTKRGAAVDALYAGNGNPHIQHVDDAERLARTTFRNDPRVEAIVRDRRIK